MRRSFTFFFLVLALGFGCNPPARAQESLAPVSALAPVFTPLWADPREPQNSLVFSGQLNQYDLSLGGSLDLVRWEGGDGEHWACGLLGSGYLSILRYSWASYRLEAMDLWMGAIVSESSGAFSHRLEALHGTSHLGDWDFTSGTAPVAWSRDGLQYTGSIRACEALRLYGGMGWWWRATPSAAPVFLHLGADLASGYSAVAGGRVRAFLACDLKLGDGAAGELEQNEQLGIQFKGRDGDSAGLRLAVLYHGGRSDYGQFDSRDDSHWGLGLFFDP